MYAILYVNSDISFAFKFFGRHKLNLDLRAFIVQFFDSSTKLI